MKNHSKKKKKKMKKWTPKDLNELDLTSKISTQIYTLK